MTTVDGIRCPNCQRELPGNANVCGYCGHRLKQVPDSTSSLSMAALPTVSLSPAAAVGALLVMLGSTLPWFGTLGNLQTAWEVTLRQLFSVEPSVAPNLPAIGAGLLILAVPALWLSLAGKAPRWRSVLGLLCVLIVAWFMLWRMVGYGETFMSAVQAGQVVVTLGALLLIAARWLPR
ncbi:MAG: zinc ribbon domain-containing protein [Acidimicrobiia bacterium]|nr:zinc ribbon domain-containing protein [Acidimicrobiia bacterium]